MTLFDTTGVALTYNMPVVTRSARKKLLMSEDRQQPTKEEESEEEDSNGDSDEGDERAGAKEEASIISIMEQMTTETFPTELLETIIRFTLRSAIGSCAISDDNPAIDTWEAQATQARGLTLPANLSPNARHRIQQAVAATFPKSVVLGVPVKFAKCPRSSSSSTTTSPSFVVPLAIYRRDSHRDKTGLKVRVSFAVPRVLQGSEHQLRSLVLNVRVSNQRAGYERELKMATHGMENLAQTFPGLESCLFVVSVGSGDRDVVKEFFPSFLLRGSRHPVYWEGVLIDFIDAFAKRGPGKRKLFRFDHFATVRGHPHVGVGPTLRVDGGRKRVDDGNSVTEVVQSEELDEAERLLYQAYRLKRQVPCRVDGSSR